MQVFEGTDRVAYVGDVNTYKVAKSDAGLEANKIEALLAGGFGEFVVPTVAYDYVNVQPTVPIVTLEFTTLWKCFPWQIQAWYSGSLAHLLERPGNLGIHEEKVKFIDAGHLALAAIMTTYPGALAEGMHAVNELTKSVEAVSSVH